MAIYLFGIAFGLFLITAALMNWDWLFAHEELEVIQGVFGELAARIVCGLLGTACVVLTVLFWTTVL